MKIKDVEKQVGISKANISKILRRRRTDPSGT